MRDTTPAVVESRGKVMGSIVTTSSVAVGQGLVVGLACAIRAPPCTVRAASGYAWQGVLPRSTALLSLKDLLVSK